MALESDARCPHCNAPLRVGHAVSDWRGGIRLVTCPVMRGLLFYDGDNAVPREAHVNG